MYIKLAIIHVCICVSLIFLNSCSYLPQIFEVAEDVVEFEQTIEDELCEEEIGNER